MDGAAGLCVARGNASVEIAHWLAKLAESPDGDVSLILEEFGINRSRFLGDATRAIDRLRGGDARPPVLSPQLVDLTREAWLIASIDYDAPMIRSSHLIVALLNDEVLQQVGDGISRELMGIPLADLKARLPEIVAASTEQSAAVSPGTAGGTATMSGDTPFLDQYTIDLTEMARAGKIDPVVGRDVEVRQMIDILTRRRQNNPVLVGEAGVGKTAVVEGLALQIAYESVPTVLRNVILRSLDLGLLQAGASVRGEFENRLRGVIDEVKNSAQPVILFIDEAHMLIGAGGQAGTGDAANLLKPALARGELRTIAATTWAEYKKIFEQDAALTRRFQLVKIEEPDDDKAIAMMRGVVPALSMHHQVDILDEAVSDSVKMSRRYIAGRQLPDKSVSLLDTACARVSLGQMCAPGPVEDCERAIDLVSAEIAFLENEAKTGREDSTRLSTLRSKKDELQARWSSLSDQWKAEEEVVQQIRQLRRAALAVPEDGSAAEPSDPQEIRLQLQQLESQLREIQQEHPLMHPFVTSAVVAEIISEWTGIPVGRMVSDEVETMLELSELLKRRVVGQDHALNITAERIKSARAGLTDPTRPIGVFLFAGPSGVGKTESAFALADLLYGGRQSLTIINMSEFKEEHKVSMLTGSPPGYVGYGEGGILSDAIRRRPYGVVLLDEIEKAHPGVQDVFYQVFDKGMLRDGQGRDIDCRNTVFILTSNVGTDLIAKVCADPETAPTPEKLGILLHEELLKTFKPAFLGRTTVVPYYPLSKEVLAEITRMSFGRLAERIRENYSSELVVQQSLIDSLVDRCAGSDGGARIIDRFITNEILPRIATDFLSRTAAEMPMGRVELGYDPTRCEVEFQFHAT
ncbi:MAG: type VI secretion system ATPase TssH [Planctomycetaceae bacterium]|nr:type VI secretion system ATPase TssH [Planctomycetaceae bacterium]